MSERIEIVPYDPSWPSRFERERELLAQILGSWLTGEIEHVGSTAVPGLAAKPVIDIMAPVASLEASRPTLERLAAIDYRHAPYRADVMHWLCKPEPARRTHHLHLVPGGSRLWMERIRFRNALRADAGLAREYATLKGALASMHRGDREAYTEAKGPFIAAALRRALPPPSIALVRMERSPENFDLALAVKREAMGPYVIPRWGWDAAEQRGTLEAHWESREFFRIVAAGRTAGTVSIEHKAGERVLSDFYLFTAFQGVGIGASVLSGILGDASQAAEPVTLRVIKWNPACALYERHGFVADGETETHYLMRWIPTSSLAAR
ncbi:MAG TPA: bifunctional GrpB family protein/GNAT family N-acetyltransferase [Usitatibacter sp.]|nr:bifunctional GrpB family protein/GNAT family N-acetyltransferase [Usitatibacter sp.]